MNPFLNRSVFASLICVTLVCSVVGCRKGPAPAQKPSATPRAQRTPTPGQAAAAVKALWSARSAYEKDGQVVVFADCGLYRSNTNELTGAKCEYKNGRWVLLEPKLKPMDNLIRNGDLSAWTNGTGPFAAKGTFADFWLMSAREPGKLTIEANIPSPGAEPAGMTVQMDRSPGGAVQVENGVEKAVVPLLAGKYVTLNCSLKQISGNSPVIRVGHSAAKESLGYILSDPATVCFSLEDSYNRLIVTHKFGADFGKSPWAYVVLGIGAGRKSEFIAKDFALVRGYLPMGFEL